MRFPSATGAVSMDQIMSDLDPDSADRAVR
jgi:hypothetical protein